MSDCPNSVGSNLFVVIGASAGSLEPISEITSSLPASFQGIILVATHRPPDLEGNTLKDILGRHASLDVREPIEHEKFLCSSIYVNRPPDSMSLQGDEARLKKVGEEIGRMERIDDLFSSVATHAGADAVGVILSGALWDGVKGLAAIHGSGGRCIVQDPREAAFSGLPSNAIEEVPVDFVGTVSEIIHILVELGENRECR